jgi:putative transcriptional regulator
VKNNIRNCMQERGLKVSFVLKKTGISKSHFYDIMHGRSVPGLAVARKISQVIGVPIDTLFPPCEGGN